ncbi:MAG: non-ribosomal peptide synthetase [Candidatus Helarchaeota archaeon]
MINQTIYTKFEEIASQFPGNTAIEEEDKSIIYENLKFFTNRLANSLIIIRKNIQEVVCVHLESSIEYVISILGILKAGKIFMPINTHFPHTRTDLIFEKTKPTILITNEAFEKQLQLNFLKMNHKKSIKYIIVLDKSFNFVVKKLPSWELEKKHSSYQIENPRLKTPSDDGCYIITTSGSTGKPKAILGSQKGLTHFINWETNEFNLNENTKVSFLSHVTFDVSLRDIFIPLCTGGTLCIPKEETKQNPFKLYKWIQNNRITLIHIVPTLFRLLTKAIHEFSNEKNVFPNLKYILIAGETLYGNDIINWRNIVGNHVELVNIYGPTETTLAKLFYRIKDKTIAPEEIVPLGKPIPDTKIMIIKNDKLCTNGEIGEIHIKTPYMSKGYFNDPVLNKMFFIKDPIKTNGSEIVYRTGDLGKFLPDGNIQFIGRKDNQIKLYGKRIELGEIEVVLNQHSKIKQVAVAVKKDSFGIQRLIAYIVLKSNEKTPINTFREFLKNRLPDYMIPNIYLILKELPLTSSGKIDRKALPEPDNIRPEIEQNFTPPSNSLEKMLSKVWCEVLKINQVGIDDNFFDLGGNSILTAEVITKLQKELGFEIPLVKMFQYPNIRSFAKYINQQEDENSFHQNIQTRARLRRATFKRNKNFKKRN